MTKITITLADSSKQELLIELLNELAFVDTVIVTEDTPATEVAEQGEGSIFDATGIWKDRNVDARQLRNKAWKNRVTSRIY